MNILFDRLQEEFPSSLLPPAGISQEAGTIYAAPRRFDMQVALGINALISGWAIGDRRSLSWRISLQLSNRINGVSFHHKHDCFFGGSCLMHDAS